MLDKILLIKDLLELAYTYRKLLTILMLIALILFILLVGWVGSIERNQQTELLRNWNSLNAGDSVFVRDNVYRLEFFKKGREKLNEYEQREIKYRREDTINFTRKNVVPEKYFYQNNTSFIGICLGKDSSITKAGNYDGDLWIKIKPSYQITHPPKSDKYDYDSRKWYEESTSYNFVGELSKDYYVNLADIQSINNDSIFK